MYLAVAAYSVPRASRHDTGSFLLQCVLSDQMIGIGRRRMSRSRAALKMPVIIHIER